MDRDEAVEVYKELVTKCQLAAPYVSLVPHKKNDTLSQGYQLHIRVNIAGGDRKIIQTIVNSHKLAWTESGENIIIYKPKTV